jgi:hypothetical protein
MHILVRLCAADNFGEYARHALGWLGIADVTDEEIEHASRLAEEHTKRVTALYAVRVITRHAAGSNGAVRNTSRTLQSTMQVRLLLGRLTEFVILFDRVLWLHENIAGLRVAPCRDSASP